MSELHYLDGRVKRVKNLGWLLRNWKRVDRTLGFKLTGTSDGGCRLVARLRLDYPVLPNAEPHSYVTDFASLTVCWSWLDRPVFGGISCQVRPSVVSRTVDMVIGGANWEYWNIEFKRANTAGRLRETMARFAAI